MIIGEIPQEFCCLASADSIYLREHGPALLSSAIEAGNNLHLHVINASEEDWLFLHELSLHALGKIKFTYTSEDTDLSNLMKEQRRVYYSCNRFIAAGQLLLNNSGPLMIIDIDCLIMNKIEQPIEDIGLFLREPFPNANQWETLGSHVAAGAVYYSKSKIASRFAVEVGHTLLRNELIWFLDQVTLWEVYKQRKDEMDVRIFDGDFMDWTFKEGTTIWTGKGPRKYDNPTYVSKKKDFESKYPNLQEVVWKDTSLVGKKVLILKPRLDVMFKQGPVPQTRGSIDPIRTHWAKFVEGARSEHECRGDEVSVVELPNWQFSPELVCRLKPDIAYIPHKESHSFPIPEIENIDVRYYMQTVFPWRFYVDPLGFAGGSSMKPETLVEEGDLDNSFADLRKYSLEGGTKFEQPQPRTLKLNQEFVFFPCQIPHDETIKYHSDVSVPVALEMTIDVCQELGLQVIVKGHPVNPGSMGPLQKITNRYDNAVWMQNINIYDILPKAKAVVMVNSGTGMESLLHHKPVIMFGRAEYSCVAHQIRKDGQDGRILDREDLKDKILNGTFDLERVRKFYSGWCKWTIDTKNQIEFIKLKP